MLWIEMVRKEEKEFRRMWDWSRVKEFSLGLWSDIF